MDAPISFRVVRPSDMALLHRWLSSPHVVEWWEPAPTLADVEADYLPHCKDETVRPLDAPDGVVHYVALGGGEPFGFVQCYRVIAHQEDGYWLSETDPCAVGIDQYIGLPDRIGQGLGTRMLRAFIALTFEDLRVTSIQTDPKPENTRAIAAYRKAGFQDVGECDTPDGRALLMRIRRPG